MRFLKIASNGSLEGAVLIRASMHECMSARETCPARIVFCILVEIFCCLILLLDCIVARSIFVLCEDKTRLGARMRPMTDRGTRITVRETSIQRSIACVIVSALYLYGMYGLCGLFARGGAFALCVEVEGVPTGVRPAGRLAHESS